MKRRRKAERAYNPWLPEPHWSEEWYDEQDPPTPVPTVEVHDAPVLFDADGYEIELRRPIGFRR